MNNNDNFIMLPTNDFCFKELMQNPKVRKGFIAGILGKDPKEVYPFDEKQQFFHHIARLYAEYIREGETLVYVSGASL